MENIEVQQEKANKLLATLQEAENHIFHVQSAVGTGVERTIDLCSCLDAKKFLCKQLLLLEKKLLSCESASDIALVTHSIAEIGKVIIKY